MSVDGLSGDGMILGDDNVRYGFSASAARHFIQVGDRVEFAAANGHAADIRLLSSGPRYSREDVSSGEQRGLWVLFADCVTHKFINATGRASRKEYWSFVLFFWLITLGNMFISTTLRFSGWTPLSWLGGALSLVGGLAFIALLIPGFCVLVRRLHDVDWTGWAVLLIFVPFGSIALFVATVLPSHSGRNDHGPMPGAPGRSTADVFS